jgi:LPXTG-site transpeptidase (sortase) family protein
MNKLMKEKNTKQNNHLTKLGSFLMGLSFLPFLLIYYPIITYSLKPPTHAQATSIDTTTFSIHIPKINVTSRVIEEVDPWNQEEYKKALRQGIAHASGTSLPGENGTVFMFAHSSDSPLNTTRYNIPFLFLDNLEKQDKIFITKDSVRYVYQVREKKVVWPNETRYLKETSKKQLILQTCYPLGTTFQRLLVFADPV